MKRKPIYQEGHYTVYKRSPRSAKVPGCELRHESEPIECLASGKLNYELYYQFALIARVASEDAAHAIVPLHQEWIKLRSSVSGAKTHEENMQRYPELVERWIEIGYIPDWLKLQAAGYEEWLRSPRVEIEEVPDFLKWLERRGWWGVKEMRRRALNLAKAIEDGSFVPKPKLFQWNETDNFYAKGMGVKWEDDND